MSRFRKLIRWILTTLAVVLVVIACLITGVRMLAWQSDRLAPHALAWLAAELDVTGNIAHLTLDLDRLDPELGVDDLSFESREGQPLLAFNHAAARLDVVESFRQGFPILDHARVRGVTLHLYADPDGGWTWPDGAGARWFGDSETPSQGEGRSVDDWLRVLVHQRGDIEDATLVLHGTQDTQRLVLDRASLASNGSQASFQARLEDAATLDVAIDADGADSEVDNTDGEPSPRARFESTADLNALSPALATLTSVYPKRLAELQGRIEAAGSWHDGGIHKARVTLDAPSLQVSDTRTLASQRFEDLHLKAGADRKADGEWQAWVDELRVSSPGIPRVEWPASVQAQSTPDGWRLRTTAFELDGVSDYLRLLPLPLEAIQPLIQLAPKGHVAGVELGQQDGEWYAQGALEGVTVDAWDSIPGGGPIDAWATFRGRGGSVTFVGNEATHFAIPSVYADPLDLSSASGVIEWALTEDGAVLSGERLKAQWRGASAEGRFGLAFFDDEDKPGNFRLDIDFKDADARGSRVLSWLPTRIIDDPKLRQWFAGDIGGIVEQGALRLSLTLNDAEAPEGKMFVNPDDSLVLSLDIADGRLQYAPDWPALERVYGHLEMHNMNLEGHVTHATSHGLTTRDATVSLENQLLSVDADIAGESGGLLDFLANAPVEGLSEAFDLWQSEGQVQATMHLELPMDEQSQAETDLRVDIDATADVDTLIFPELQLALSGINGDLHYRRLDGENYVEGKLGARAFEGPVLATFDIGGKASGDSHIGLEGRALGRGLLDWAGLSKVGGLLDGYFPYRASVEFDAEDNASFSLRSDLDNLAVNLPPPFGKSAARRDSLVIDANIAEGSGELTLGDSAHARWHTLGEQVQGQVWLEGWPGDEAAWPSEPGWYVLWRPDRLDTQRWAQALTELSAAPSSASSESGVPRSIEDDVGEPKARPVNDGGGLKRVAITTPCVLVEGRCLGGLQADASPLSGGWQLSLGGGIVSGQANWLPKESTPIDIDLTRLNLDALTPEPSESESDEDVDASLMERIDTAPRPAALPEALAKVPAGHVRIEEFQRDGQRFGPLEARWQAEDDRLTLDPLSLTLGEIESRGSLTWEGAGDASLTRAEVTADGGNLATAFQALGTPVPITSQSTRANAQLSWPGAPWQLALPRASGRAQVTLNDGRLRQLHSSSAKLVGLFNVDNILRRLQLDFSDVTDGGTAFNRLDGSATLYNGILETQGPVVIDGTSTRFTLAGSVDLNRQRLDQRLGITVPVSQNLPLIAVMAGAPQIGVGLFVFHKLFGQWLDSATQIYYRIEGPWASPNVELESAE